MTLKACGFTIDELGALPLKSWVALYGAARATYWEDKATDVSVSHPAKPAEVQRRFLAASRKSWGAGGKPFWADPKRMRAWLGGMRGVVVRERKNKDA